MKKKAGKKKERRQSIYERLSNYFSTVIVCFRSIVGELTIFSFTESSISFFLLDQEREGTSPVILFLIQLEKEKKVIEPSLGLLRMSQINDLAH
jgi:hypothetical protein